MSYGHVAAIALLAYLFLDRPVRFVLLRWLQNSTTFGAKVHEVLRFMVLCAWGATALLACAAVLKIEPKPASAFDAATRLDVLAAVAALAFLGLSQLATILANRKSGETIVRPLVASAHFTRFFAVFLGVTALASLGVQHATTLGYDGGWLAPFGHMLEATTPAQLSLAALATVLAIRVLGEPALRRMVIAAKPRPSLWLVGTFGAVDALASVAFLLTISAGVTALALLLLRLFIELDGATISTVMADRVVGSVRELQRGFSHLHGRLVLGFAAMLAAGIAYGAWRGRRTQIAGLIEKERAAQFDALIAKAKCGELAQLEPTPAMARLIAAAKDIDARVSAHLEEHGQDLTSVEQKSVKAAINQRDYYLNTFGYLDLDRRVNIKIDHAELRLSGPRTLAGRLGGLFVCRGALGVLSGASRATFIASSLLFVPASLAVVGALPATDLSLALTVHQIDKLRIAVVARSSDTAFGQEADATEAKAILSSPPEQEAQDETDWCTAATASCDRLAMSRLAMAFEQVYARSVMRRIGISVASSGRQNALAQEGVLHEASLRKVSAEVDFVHPSHGTRFGSTSIDEFLFTQRAGAADPAYESAERSRFKVFLSREFVEQRPKAWQSIKTALASQANLFRQMPSRALMEHALVLRAVGLGLSMASAAPGGIEMAFDNTVSRTISEKAVHTDSIDLHAKAFMSELMRTGDLAKATARLIDLPMFDAGFSRFEAAELQRVNPRIEVVHRTMEERPATLDRVSDIIETPRLAAAVKALPEGANVKSPRDLRFIAGYNENFPPNRRGGPATPDPTRPSVGPRPPSGSGGSGNAYEFSRMHGSPRVGGVVFGRPFENAGASIDIRNISWQRDGNGVVLELIGADGSRTRLGWARAQSVHLALAYVADGRLVPATVLNAEPLFDHRVSLHPALLDTALGCRILAMDFYVFDLTGDDEVVVSEMNHVLNFQQLFRLAWVERGTAILDLLKADERSGVQSPVNNDVIGRYIADEKQDLRSDEELATLLAGLDPAAGLTLADAKPEYFDRTLVTSIRACTDQLMRLADARTCLRRNSSGAVAREREAATMVAAGQRPGMPRGLPGGIDQFPSQFPGLGGSSARPVRLTAKAVLQDLTPPPRYDFVSGVREVPWKLDDALEFARLDRAPESGMEPDRPYDRQSALEFSIQVAFTSAPYWKRGVEDWWQQGEKPNLASAFDESPWQFPRIAQRVRQAVADIRQDNVRRDELGPVEEFVRLQRLFRAAFAGHFGAAFPAHKLVELTRDTRASVVEMRTPRWKAHPGLLEHYYLRTLHDSMFRNAGISETARATANACLSLADVKEGENPSLWPATSEGRARVAALASIGQPAWTAACVLPEKDGGGWSAAQNVQKLGDRIAKLRELRAALGIDAAIDQKPLGPKGGGVCAPM